MDAMGTVEQLLETIDSIYAAPMTQGGWSAALSQISTLTGGVASTYSGSFGQKSQFTPDFVLCDEDIRGVLSKYTEYYHTICTRGRFSLLEPVGTPYFDYKYLTETQIDRHEYYDFLRRSGVKYAMGTTLGRPGATPDQTGTQQCAVHFAASQGHPDQNKLTLFSRLIPHLMRANSMVQRLQGQLDEVHELQTALDRLSIAVFCLSADFTVEHANKRAEQLLSKQDGISLHGRRLHVHSHEDRQLFNGLLTRLRGESRASPSANTTMTIRRPSGDRDYVLFLSPITLPYVDDKDGVYHETRFLAFVTDPNAAVTGDAEHLRAMFKFTPAETDLAIALINGDSLHLYAQRAGVSGETVRWHLKNIFAKTSTNKQAELVGLLIKILLPMRQ